MAIDNIENYKNLAYAILMQQCIDYERLYKAFIKHPCRVTESRMSYARYELINHSWAKYLSIDIEASVEAIEKKVKRGEKIIWKQQRK